jgi:WhiB family redox-sensing transcriptional regulator
MTSLDAITHDTLTDDTLTHDPPTHDAGTLDDTDLESRSSPTAIRDAPTGVDEACAARDRARCADGHGTLTHLFFSEHELDLARAKAICGKCGLADRCLAGALDRSEPYGVWGGELLVDGRVVLVKRGRGRPPRQPRPPLVVDEVPVPPHLVDRTTSCSRPA